MLPHAEHRKAQAGGLRASEKFIVRAVKISKDRLSRDVAEAPCVCMTRTQLREAAPAPRQSHVDFARVEGRNAMRCQAIAARR